MSRARYSLAATLILLLAPTALIGIAVACYRLADLLWAALELAQPSHQ